MAAPLKSHMKKQEAESVKGKGAEKAETKTYGYWSHIQDDSSKVAPSHL